MVCYGWDFKLIFNIKEEEEEEEEYVNIKGERKKPINWSNQENKKK